MMGRGNITPNLRYRVHEKVRSYTIENSDTRAPGQDSHGFLSQLVDEKG